MSSESDPEGPIAAQMLSFVMDDPDFESEESDTQRRAVRTGCWLGSSASILPEIEDNQGLFPRARSEERQESVPGPSAPRHNPFLTCFWSLLEKVDRSPWEGVCVAIVKALLVVLNLGQVNPSRSTSSQPLDSQRDLPPCSKGPVAVVRDHRPTANLSLQEAFPVREDLSDVTDEDTGSAQPPLPSKPPVPAFRLKNDSDLFGLGLEETGPKESSDEGRRQGLGLVPLLRAWDNLEVPILC